MIKKDLFINLDKTALLPHGNFALKEQSFLHQMETVCTLYLECCLKTLPMTITNIAEIYVFPKMSRVMTHLFMSYVNNKDTDQPAHLHSLISVFVIHSLDSIMPTDFKTLVSFCT